VRRTCSIRNRHLVGDNSPSRRLNERSHPCDGEAPSSHGLRASPAPPRLTALDRLVRLHLDRGQVDGVLRVRVAESWQPSWQEPSDGLRDAEWMPRPLSSETSTRGGEHEPQREAQHEGEEHDQHNAPTRFHGFSMRHVVERHFLDALRWTCQHQGGLWHADVLTSRVRQ
jgi:hypothetical protein